MRSDPVPFQSALIAEDEPLLAEELREAIGELWPELRIAAIASDGVAALREFERCAPQVAFLDIHLPRIDGLEVARQIGRRAHIAFITAFDSHAIQAFETGAVDYVLKPIEMARLAATIQRLKDRIGSPAPNLETVLRQDDEAPSKGHLQWIKASRNNGVRMIMVDDVCYFKADQKYTLVVEPGNESVIRMTIRELHDQLDPTMFWQIHRSTVVNVAAIDGVLRDGRGGLQLQLKQRQERLTVSEQYFPLFRQM
jgi:DNA-binding LytR/AlgR family response regulator